MRLDATIFDGIVPSIAAESGVRNVFIGDVGVFEFIPVAESDIAGGTAKAEVSLGGAFVVGARGAVLAFVAVVGGVAQCGAAEEVVRVLRVDKGRRKE